MFERDTILATHYRELGLLIKTGFVVLRWIKLLFRKGEQK
jgi:hypothetical protein